MVKIIINKRKIGYFGVLTAVAIYTLLKIYRNSIDYANTTQGGIWNIILACIVIVSILKCVLNVRLVLPAPMQIAVAYAIIVWLNGLLAGNISSMSLVYYYLVAPCFASVMYLMYSYSQCGTSEKAMKLWDTAWFVILALLLYTYIAYFGQYKYYESEGKIALNNSYYAACAIPFFLRKGNKAGLLFAAVSIAVIFISNKRTGLIAIVLALVAYYLINAQLSESFTKALKKVLIGGFVLVVLFAAFVLVDSKFNLNIIRRLMQLSEDGGSGRTLIYEYVFEQIKTSDLINIIIGHGVASINHMSMSISSAHSDFLNVFYEYGIFAVLLLIAFYLSMFATLKRMVRTRYNYSPCFAFSIVVSLFFSLFSANLDNQSFSIILAVYWGIEIRAWQQTTLNNERVYQ